MVKSLKNILIVLLHISGWLVFLSIPTMFNPRRPDFSIASFINDLLELPRWTNGLLLVILFYYNYHIAIPRFYLGRKYPFLALSILGSFIILFLLNYVLIPRDIKFTRVQTRWGAVSTCSCSSSFMFSHLPHASMSNGSLQKSRC